ncbi:hypothetical protein ACFQ4C_30355 [Larkinella insperata]|uniref:Uncharacterized protein n=1 Tax=Larkinella insperata TaxID=332158 RepID=A0ABW3QFI6_9BACT
MNPNTPLPQSYLPDKENSFQFNWKAGLRYYHAMPKKIKKGRSANNFSSNYLALQIAQPVRTYNRSTVYSPLLDLEQTRQWSDNLLDNPTPRLLIAYGFQRRLGTLAYADLYAGPEIQFSDYHLGPSFSFQLHALVGLGW